MRLGGAMVSPFIQMANFTMISFLWINNIIPIEIFAPIFVILGVSTLSYIGVRFRKHQASTDYNLLFEKQSQQAKVFYHIMLSQKLLMEKQGVIPSEKFTEQLDFVKRISEEKV